MIIYTVKESDTLVTIGNEYGISPERIASDNMIKADVPLVAGQTLVLLFPTVTYTVKAGDTLSSVADEYGITIRELWKNNPILKGGEEIYEGQTLVISYGEKPMGKIRLNGYAYTYVNDETLDTTLPYLTYLSIFSYGLRSDGTLIYPDGDERLIQAAKKYGAVPILMLTSLNENGTFSSELINEILANKELSDKVISETVATVREKGYGGVETDFEYIDGALAENYADFVRRLRAALGENITVMTDLAPKTSSEQKGLLYEAHDYKQLGAAADLLFLMTYEWGYRYGPPMAVSPVKNVRRVIEYAISEIPPQKILKGIPSYGYDWPLPYERGVTEAMTLSALEAVELARREGVSIDYDTEAAAPFFNYTDRSGRPHVVWFQDARSAESLSELIREYSLRGAGIWNIMRLFPELWLVLNGNFEIEKL